MEPKVYHLSEKEVHMVGEVVGVVWNTKTMKKRLIGDDGLEYKAEVQVREGNPYIDFFNIREDNEEFYEDEDSPVDGGLDASFAEKVAYEILEAVKYYKTVI